MQAHFSLIPFAIGVINSFLLDPSVFLLHYKPLSPQQIDNIMSNMVLFKRLFLVCSFSLVWCFVRFHSHCVPIRLCPTVFVEKRCILLRVLQNRQDLGHTVHYYFIMG